MFASIEGSFIVVIAGRGWNAAVAIWTDLAEASVFAQYDDARQVALVSGGIIMDIGW
jgi:hypothetical protein